MDGSLAHVMQALQALQALQWLAVTLDEINERIRIKRDGLEAARADENGP